MNDGQMRKTRCAWRVGFWNIRHLDKALALLGCWTEEQLSDREQVWNVPRHYQKPYSSLFRAVPLSRHQIMKAYNGRVGKDPRILTLVQRGMCDVRLGCFTHGSPLGGPKWKITKCLRKRRQINNETDKGHEGTMKEGDGNKLREGKKSRKE
jgi:hypothetical protein